MKMLNWLWRKKKPCSCGKANWEVINGHGEVFVMSLTRATAEHVANNLSCKDGGWATDERYFARRMKYKQRWR